VTAPHATGLALLVVLAAAVGAGGYALGRSGGPSLAHARATGAQRGLTTGQAGATRDGYHAGFEAGSAAGYRSTYRPAYRASYRHEARRLDARARIRRARNRARARNRSRTVPPPPPAPPDSGRGTPPSVVVRENGVERQLRECANIERQRAGLPPLAANPVLDGAARFHARNMLVHDFFSHYGPVDGSPAQRVARFNGGRRFVGVGENIAAGQVSARQTCSDWMSSPGHRANILDPRFKLIGAGFVHGSSGYFDYYVQNFAIAAR
jgi:uncharacterized protein YkwD